MNLASPKILFEMNCKFLVFREYSIPYMSYQPIKCSRTSDNMASPTIKASAKVFAELLKNFPNSTTEATLWMYDNHVRFKTFIESDDENYFNLPSTSFSYMSNDFQSYNFTEEFSITFSIREVKAFFEFASHENQLVSAYFKNDSGPIEFYFQNNVAHFSGRLISSTFDFQDDIKPIPPSFDAADHINRANSRSQNSFVNTSSISLNYTSTVADVSIDSNFPNNNPIPEAVDSSPIADNVQNDNFQQESEGHKLVTTIETQPDSIKQENITTGTPVGDCSQFNMENDFQSTISNDENDIDNIESIIQNLPDFTKNSDDENELFDDQISLIGSQLASYHRKFLNLDPHNFDSQSVVSYYLSDSDKESNSSD